MTAETLMTIGSGGCAVVFGFEIARIIVARRWAGQSVCRPAPRSAWAKLALIGMPLAILLFACGVYKGGFRPLYHTLYFVFMIEVVFYALFLKGPTIARLLK